jgi:GT2 family glycosyltransferase
MKISLIATIKNDVDSVDLLMESISMQTKLPDEIIITDADDKEDTFEKLNSWKNKLNNLIIIQKAGCFHAEGRNLAIAYATGNIIAATDFGCKLDDRWIEEITSPIESGGYDVVAGYYFNNDKRLLSKANSYFTHPALFEIDENTFLPSARSIAFKKECWSKVGGFDIKFIGGEDTKFSLSLKRSKAKVKFNKNALVEWNAEDTILKMIKKLLHYSKWDGIGGFSKKFYYMMISKIAVMVIMIIFSFFNLYILYLSALFLSLFFLKTFFKARKKEIGNYSAVLAALLKPIYNIFQSCGFIYGRFLRIK